MRKPSPIHIPIAIVIACLLAGALPRESRAIDCSGDSTGLVPMNDLATGFYQSFQGGLYGGRFSGSLNARPAAHQAAGLAIAGAIAPLDTLGQPDPNGRIVLISIGMSNATQEFQAFVPKAMNDPERNPSVLVIDCAQGGQAANRINTPSAAYWDTVAARLRRRGSSPLQAQVVWIKEADASPTGGFPAATETLRANLASIVRILKQDLPNVRLAYLTSRIYAGYATTLLNPEPYAYESAFAVKWLIDDQVSGVDSLNFDGAQGPVEAPWISWGPYLWADGLEPRSDGLVWPCDFFASDGTHPGPSARNLVADSLLAFFKSDATTKPWFVGGTTSAEGPASDDRTLTVVPNPARGALEIAFTAAQGEAWELEVVNAAGRNVRVLSRGVGSGALKRARWNVDRDAEGRLAPGIYWIRLRGERSSVVRRITLLPR